VTLSRKRYMWTSQSQRKHFMDVYVLIPTDITSTHNIGPGPIIMPGSTQPHTCRNYRTELLTTLKLALITHKFTF